MIHLLIVGDGERDARTVPGLVRGILEQEIRVETRPWAHLHGGGYERKIKFAFLQARDARVEGLVAVVDADNTKNRERLKVMKAAREEDRQKMPALPTALGEAVPHGEAWLLDDPVAIRQTLRLENDAAIPNVRDCEYPKTDLQVLFRSCPRAEEEILDLLEQIAAQVSFARCAHAKDTGFHDFREEVLGEIRPLRR